MELWYTDEHTDDVRFSMKAAEQLASKKSAVQQIDILDTPAFGRVLVLDGGLMITEKDEFIYHEMITHVPMAVHPNVKNVLVIGGGDGGTVRELVKPIMNIELLRSDLGKMADANDFTVSNRECMDCWTGKGSLASQVCADCQIKLECITDQFNEQCTPVEDFNKLIGKEFFFTF